MGVERNLIYIGSLGVLSLVLVILTPMVSYAMWKFYRLLALYHPTPADLEDLEESGELDEDDEKEDYITESWVAKFGYSFAINIITVSISLIMMFIYGVIILSLDVTPAAVAGSGIVVAAVNVSLRVADKVDIRGETIRIEDGAELLSFGHTFFTSIWVLCAIGGTMMVLSGASPGMGLPESWTLVGTSAWIATLIIFVVLLSLVSELVLSKYIQVSSITLEYDAKALKRKLDEEFNE